MINADAAPAPVTVVARAPGRVNLIGDHTDYTGGLCFPIAIDRAVTISGRTELDAPTVRLRSAQQRGDADVPLDVAEPAALEPEWARYVAGVVSQLRPPHGFTGTVDSDVPVGSGLSSSAALEVACALALGADPSDVVTLARLCQAAEHAARGVPTGLLDQLASIGGVAGCALRLDCRTLELTAVPLPPSSVAEWIVVWAGARSLADSGYGQRVSELGIAEDRIGPLRDVDHVDDLADIADPVIRRRARHVVTENGRVDDFATAIGAGELVAAGELMVASQRSLRDDFDCSTPAIDELCAALTRRGGVHGARMTGGGWGGCVVALTDTGAVDPTDFPTAWTVVASAGATVQHHQV